MRDEKDYKPQDRFLIIDEIFSDEAVVICQRECFTRVQAKNLKVGTAFNRFINWKRAKSEISLSTLYAYADLDLPKSFDCIFNLENPSDFISTQFKITQSIFEGWYPINSVEHGHKHLCVFEFENEIPKIIYRLQVSSNKRLDLSKRSIKLGICLSEDRLAIENRLKYIIGLKEKHGNEWWKYDKEI